jgi:nitrite reductase/ring-hydroxylating ferredoxin subunit
VIPLCRLEELTDPGSAAFTLTDGSPILVVRKGSAVFAYRNYCPHAGHPLDWTPGQFLDLDRNFILCASHGASFLIESGYCVGGPCAGKSLDSLPVHLEDGVVWA